jgi:hypothetical protein
MPGDAFVGGTPREQVIDESTRLVRALVPRIDDADGHLLARTCAGNVEQIALLDVNTSGRDGFEFSKLSEGSEF